MSSIIAEEMQALVRQAAEPVSAGETIKAQMVRAWDRLGRPAWWRLKAAWYGEAGGFSAQAARDIQQRFLRWREAEDNRAAHAAEISRILRRQHDQSALHAARADHLRALSQIELRLAALDPNEG